MPTPDELAAKIRELWAELADEVAALDDPPDPAPAPEPAPQPGPPAKPTGLACQIGPDGRPDLRWDSAPAVTAWEVHDLLGAAPTLRATVTEPRSIRSALKAGQRRRYAVLAVGPGGRSEMSDGLDVPPASGPDPAPVPAPSSSPSAVDLSQWKLTIPETKDGKVVEIRPPALATYSSRYFEHLADGSLRFRCWHGGATTSGSSNPRSELRERVDGDPEGYWVAGKGRHVMEWTGQVNRLTKVRPHIVLGQVHDSANDVVVWRLEADKLWLTDGNNNHGHLVDGAFQLGKPYTARYEIADGQYAFFYNGQRVDYALRSTANSYFKTGLYVQSNPQTAPGESTDEYAEVELHAVSVSHTSA